MEKKTSTKQEKKTSPIRRVFSGVVVSNKMKDTVVVAVSSYVKHAKYGKYVKKVKRYKVHDVGNTKQIDEKVSIEETRPISKGKMFRVL